MPQAKNMSIILKLIQAMYSQSQSCPLRNNHIVSAWLDQNSFF